MSKPQGTRCRAPEQGFTAIRDGKRVQISDRCHRPTRHPSGVCWQHRGWEEGRPENEVASRTIRELVA